MYAFKEKITEKFSYLFADSTHQSSSPSRIHQDRLNSKEERSFSSFFSSVIPSLSTNGTKDDKEYPEINSYQSLPLSCKSCDFDQDSGDDSQEPRRKNKDDGIVNAAVEASDHANQQSPASTKDECRALAGSSNDFRVLEKASKQIDSGNSMPDLTDDSVLISQELYEFLKSSLPNIVKGCKWVLVYSTLKDGISLRTLIRKSAGFPGPSVLIARDNKGAVFGAILDCPLKPPPKRKYEGTNQTSVFTTIYGEPRLFRPTGVNRYYYMCLSDMLALGGGGKYALCFDGDLLSGTSGPCDTFGNRCLAHSEDFELKNLELWGFAHASTFIT